MTDDPKKPKLPFGLNSGRIIILMLGALLLVYLVSALLGGLGNYQQLRQAADEAREAEQAPASP